MIVATWLRETEALLKKAGIETARLDALVLLSDQLVKDKAWLLAYSDTELQGSDLEILSTKVAQRSKHTPLAYIRGHVEFYGRDFMVNERVLIPRPESETIIDVLKKTIPADAAATIVDIGTGSGALAITAKLERPNTNVIATDIDEHCLSATEHNAAQLSADIKTVHSDLLSSLTLPENSVLLCNLPYVPNAYPVNDAARHEPELALYSGTDGFDHFRKLFSQTASMPIPPTHIITESLVDQHDSLTAIAHEAGYKLAETHDLIQLFQPVPRS